MDIDEKIIAKLSNYVLTQQFDSESMDWDVQNEHGGNIKNAMDNDEAFKWVKQKFAKATSMQFYLF